MKNIAIFGSTGSIGTSTLNVVRENKDLFNADFKHFFIVINFVSIQNA